jgi:Carboxypeptidase regulatory-like domain
MRPSRMPRIAVAVAFAFLVYCDLCCYAQQSDSPARAGSVEGLVIDALTNQPLRKAHVSLTAPDDSDDSSFGTVTGDTGQFSFEGVKPGKYDLSAEKVGYLRYPMRRRSRNIGETTLHLVLSPGQNLKSAELKLTPEGVISGRALDSDGDPRENARSSSLPTIGRTANGS